MATTIVTVASKGAPLSATDFDNNMINLRDTADLAMQNFDSVNVCAFGAVGDGTTDNRSAFQNAIDYIESIGGGKLFIPTGIYRLSANVLISTSGIRVEGAVGAYQGPTRVFIDGDDDCAFLVYNHTAQIRDIYFSDFEISSGAASTADIQNRTGIKFQGGYDAEHGNGVIIFVAIERMHFNRLVRGIHMYDNTGYAPMWMIDGVNIISCRFVETAIGLEIDAGNATDIKVDGCTFNLVPTYSEASKAVVVNGTSPTVESAGIYVKKAGSLAVYQMTAGCAAGYNPKKIMDDHVGWGFKAVSLGHLHMSGSFVSEGCRGILYRPTGGAFTNNFVWSLVGNVLSDFNLEGSLHLNSRDNWYAMDAHVVYDGATKWGGDAKVYTTNDRFNVSQLLVDNNGGYAQGATQMHLDTMNWPLFVGEKFRVNGDTTNTIHTVTVSGDWTAGEQDVTFTPGLAGAVADNAVLYTVVGWRMENAASSRIIRDGYIYGMPGAWTDASTFPVCANKVLVKSSNTEYLHSVPFRAGNYRVSISIVNQQAGATFSLTLWFVDEDANVNQYVVDNASVSRAVGTVIYPDFTVRSDIGNWISLQGYVTNKASDTAKITARVEFLPEPGDVFSPEYGV